MTKEGFESEIHRLEDSFKFKHMLEHNGYIQEKYDANPKEVLMIYHAFHVSVSEQLFDNPLTIGGYVTRALDEALLVPNLVREARETWGPR